MKRYLVTPKGIIAGDTSGEQSFPEIRETDLGRVGQYAMEGDNAIVDDFIRAKGAPLAVFGGDIQPGAGLMLNIYKPLRVWRATDGKQFEDFDPGVTTMELETAHSTNPRKDLIYVFIEEDVDGVQETRHLKKDPADPYSREGEGNIYTEKQNKLTIRVVKGTPAADPQEPDLPSSSAPMYVVTVPAGATSLTGNNIVDVRHNFLTLEELNEIVSGIGDVVNILQTSKHRHPANQIDIGPGAGKFSGLTDQEAWNILGNQSDDETNDPIVRPEILTPELAPSAEASGKLGSTGDADGGLGVVDVPVGRVASFFNGSLIKIEPGAFPATVEGVAINARHFNKHVSQATNSRSNTVNINLSTISSIQSDGGGDWSLRGYAMPVARARSYAGQRLACAYSATRIVVMGGAPLAGDSAVYEIDTLAGTVTQRNLSGDVPQFYIRGVFPCGDGINVIVAQQPGADGGINGSKLEWFKVNMQTYVSTKFTGIAPGYTAEDTLSGNPSAVIGDLIAPNVIFLLVKVDGVEDASAGNNRAWVYHVDTNSFEKFTPIGQNPLTGLQLNQILQDVDLCMYQPGKAVLVRGRNGISTILFDYATRTWQKQNISNPTADLNSVYGSTLWGCTLSNVNGRVQMTSETSSVWELSPGTKSQWDNRGIAPGFGSAGGGVNGTYGRGFCGFVGMLVDGLPGGDGYVIGGRVSNVPKNDIWKFLPGGIVEVSCGGVTGIGLGEGTNQASFVIDDGYTLPWQVGKVVGNPIGTLPPGSIRLEVMLDGLNWLEVPRDTPKTILTSGANPIRKWRITLFGAGNTRPCISKLNEIFEQAGGPGLVQLVIRFNVITAGVRYVYIGRDGRITIELTAQQTTPDKALLMKITPNGGLAPTPFDYVNKRLIHRKYTATRAGGATPSIANDFPVLPAYIRAFLKESDGTLKDLADPTVTFNSAIAVGGLTSNGQAYIVELEA